LRREFQQGGIEITKDISIDDNKRLVAQHRQGAKYAAPGFERARGLQRVMQPHPPLIAVAESCPDFFAEPAQINRNVGYTDCGKPFQVPNDQRFVTDFEQRFRQRIGQRPHSLASAGGKYHRSHLSCPRRNGAIPLCGRSRQDRFDRVFSVYLAVIAAARQLCHRTAAA